VIEQLKELAKGSIINNEMSLTSIVIGFLMALVLSFLISLVYRIVNYKREQYAVMMQSLILLSVTIAGAMMIIGNNLARAFGMVGAVSIIRFRLAIKSSKDMAFVFITIVVGMACGLGFRVLAMIFTALASVVLLLMNWLKFGWRRGEIHSYYVDIVYDSEKIDRSSIETEASSKVHSWECVWLKTSKKTHVVRYRVWVDDYKKLDDLVAVIKKLHTEGHIRIISFKRP
jgi:uncharacterized membrane protein YhiD involved in acid resistance